MSLLTVSSVYITVFVASGELELSGMVAALPFSSLLAVPAICALYIGSPSVGISIGKSYTYRSPQSLMCPLRRSYILRTDGDHRFMLSGFVKGPREMSTIMSTMIPRLDTLCSSLDLLTT